MAYKAYHLNYTRGTDEKLTEMLVALLYQAGFEGFHETDSGVIGYINEELIAEDINYLLRQLSEKSGIPFSIDEERLEERNWNELWERNYDTVTIADKILVRAPFHKADRLYPHEIVIEPKMSFGTGHHETTTLMLEMMLPLSLNGLDVLDYGCGTGILAIFASKLGSRQVTAIDINEWAYQNTMENALRNEVSNIKVLQGDAEKISSEKYHVILANITRNIHLAYMPRYRQCLSHGGLLLLSGILMANRHEVEKCAEKNGMTLQKMLTKGNWVALQFSTF